MENQLKIKLTPVDELDKTSVFGAEWVVSDPKGAEDTLRAYIGRKKVNSKLGACILLGMKAAKAKNTQMLLRGMRLVHEGHYGQNFEWEGRSYMVPYSFQIYQEFPACQVALASSLSTADSV
jgi:hypothetical protein